MRNKTNDDVVRMEKKATNKFGLFLIFLFVIAFFGGGGYLVYRYRDKIDWNLKLPLENKEETKKEENKTNKKEENKKRTDLIVPTGFIKAISESGCNFSFTEISLDDKGYLLKGQLSTHHSYCIFDVNQMVVDGFYITPKFTINYQSANNDPNPKTVDVRIPQTEIDNLGLNGFKVITLYYTVQNPKEKVDEKIVALNATAQFKVNNSPKGLIKIDYKGNTQVYFNKVVEASDGTYIYFNFFNEDTRNIRKILIKKLLINGKLYEIEDFEKKVYRGSMISHYIFIPKKDFRKVEEFKVSFFIIRENNQTEEHAYYITNEYTKTL